MILTFLISIFAFNIFANADFKLEGQRLIQNKFQCPVSHPEYKKVLTELKDIQSRVAAQSQCQEFVVDIKEMTNLLSQKRKGFFETINSNRDQLVSPEAAQNLQTYASEISEKALGLINYVANSEDASMTEALFGTKRCLLSEDVKYDVISRASSLVYETSNLLSMVSGPYGAPIAIGGNVLAGVIKGIGTYLDKKNSFDFTSLDKRIFFADTLCLYYQYQVEIDKLTNPEKTLSNYEKLDQHLDQKLNELASTCPECKNIIDNTPLGTSVDASAVKSINSLYAEPLGSHTKHAFETKNWLNTELQRFRGIIDFPTQGIESSEIQYINLKISKFLFEMSSPDFLKWYLRHFNEYNNKLDSSIKTLVQNLQPLWGNLSKYVVKSSYPPEVSTSAIPLLYVADHVPKYKTNPTHKYNFTEVYRTWKLQESTLNIVDEYCTFLKDSGNYPKSVLKTCESTSLKDYKDQLAWLAVGIELSRIGLESPFDLDFYSINIPRYSRHLGDSAVKLIAGRIDTHKTVGKEEPRRLSLSIPNKKIKDWDLQLEALIKDWESRAN